MQVVSSRERVTVPLIQNSKKQAGTKGGRITALTAYDFTSARLFDQAGIDILLVGDSLGTVIQGLETTLPVTLEEMSYHCRCVAKATRRALVVGDLPFLSYQISIDKAVESAGRLIKEGGVAAVKLEGGLPMAATIERLTQVDIPVMGHVGLTPQSFHRMGGHKIQGRISAGANGDLIAGTRERILEDAMAVERAGAFAVVLEGIPAELAAEITAALSIPTIGIGAGPQCDGQILVSTDLLGLNPEFKPRFVKRYAEFGEAAVSAVSHFIDEVHAGVFPAAEHSFGEAVLTQNKSRSGLKLA